MQVCSFVVCLIPLFNCVLSLPMNEQGDDSQSLVRGYHSLYHKVDSDAKLWEDSRGSRSQETNGNDERPVYDRLSKRSVNAIIDCTSLNNLFLAHHWRNASCSSLVNPYDSRYWVRCATYELENESENYVPWLEDDDVAVQGRCPGKLICANTFADKNALGDANVSDILCIKPNTLHGVTTLVSRLRHLTCSAEIVLSWLDAIYPTTYELVMAREYAQFPARSPVHGGNEGSSRQRQPTQKSPLVMDSMYITQTTSNQGKGIQIKQTPSQNTNFVAGRVIVRYHDPPMRIRFCFETPASTDWAGHWVTISWAAISVVYRKSRSGKPPFALDIGHLLTGNVHRPKVEE